MNIVLIEGATRPNSSSIKGARWVKNRILKNFEGHDVELVNPNDFDLPYDDAKDESYTKLVEWADAFILIVPEYNHGYPGKLKTLLDSEYKKYRDKPVMAIGWSNGGFGGVRAVENLIPVLRELGLILTLTNFNISRHREVFDEYGTLTDTSYEVRFDEAFGELVRLYTLLKH